MLFIISKIFRFLYQYGLLQRLVPSDIARITHIPEGTYYKFHPGTVIMTKSSWFLSITVHKTHKNTLNQRMTITTCICFPSSCTTWRHTLYSVSSRYNAV